MEPPTNRTVQRIGLDLSSPQSEYKEATVTAATQRLQEEVAPSCNPTSLSQGKETLLSSKPELQLAAIADSERHRFMLKEWKRENMFLEKDYDRKVASCRRSTADLFTILGLNFAFQGLLVSGVAPSQTLVCQHWVSVWILSGVASVGASLATARKLYEAKHNSLRLDIQAKQRIWQKARIDELKEQGCSYVFEEIQPFQLVLQDISGQGVRACWKAMIRIYIGEWVWSHAGAILGLLLAFSVAVLFCIKRLLCSN